MCPALVWVDSDLLRLAGRLASDPDAAEEVLSRAIDENRDRIGESLRAAAREQREEENRGEMAEGEVPRGEIGGAEVGDP